MNHTALNHTAFADVAEHAARTAGKMLVEMQHHVAIREKGPKDLVTEADLAAQKTIQSIIHEAYPDHRFLGEETPDAELLGRQSDGGYRWIVDPLDGTANYAHGLPSFAVSIAIESAGHVLAGVIYDPTLDECYRSTLHGGSFLNGAQLRPSNCRQLRTALTVASLAANVTRDSGEVRRFLEVLYEAQAVRRLGSSALNLCYVAAGRLDAYWATSVKIWDVAAGILILQEAGAMLSNLHGGPFELIRPELVAAATAELHTELLQVLARADADD